MKNNRRSFIKKTTFAAAGLSLWKSNLTAGNFSATGKKWDLTLGVCTSLENAGLLRSLGYNFMEESVGRYLKPAENDEIFQEQYLKYTNSQLPIVSCNSFIPGNLKSVGSETHHEEILNYAETAFRRARMSNINFIVFGSGGSRRIPEGWDETKATGQFITLLQKMAPIAKIYNIVIVLEPLNKGEVNFINSVTEGAEIVKAVNHPNFRLLADIYHMMKEDEPADSIVKHGKLIKHCHIAEKEIRSAPGVKGDDFRPYLAALKKIAYKGGLSLECRWVDFNSEVALSIDYLKKQIGQI